MPAKYKKPRRFRPTHPPPAITGSEAFGYDPEGRRTGAAAFGEGDAEHPLRGALLFGNDPMGEARGSDAVGNPTAREPLRGALFFGNDPLGNPRGSEAFGNPSQDSPLRGALLFGNDPQGEGRGADAFGSPSAELPMRGSLAVGAEQLVPRKLYKDPIGYDFGGVLLRADETSFAGIRKDPLEAIRRRINAILQRHLALVPENMRQGLRESSLPWGRIGRDSGLDRELAETLRQWWRSAPGEILGICHLWELLEETGRMHTFELRCEWERPPQTLEVYWDDDPVARVVTALHKAHKFFILRNVDGTIWGYSDTITPHRRGQEARIRLPTGEVVGTIQVRASGPGNEDGAPSVQGEVPRFEGTFLDAEEKAVFTMKEKLASDRVFLADLLDAGSDEKIGKIEDRTTDGHVETHIELDLPVPRGVVWATAALFADLARLRRSGWPDADAPEEPEIESIAEVLGPSRLKG